MSKKHINLYEAVNNLPEELITPQIYKAAIKEGNIKLLDLLPEDYLSEDNINAILDSEKNNYAWYTFSLAGIPEKARTQKVCEAAVEKSLDNYSAVPEEKRSTSMLTKLTQSAERHIHLLTLVPESSWNIDVVIQGIKSIYRSGNNNSNYRYSSGSSSDKKNQMRLIQVFLSYVPERFKSKAFYFDLFSSSMNVTDVDFLVPNKYKKKDYYLEMGKKSIRNVPLEKLTYSIIKEALLSGNNHSGDFWGGWNDASPVKEPMLRVMDEEMADIVIGKWPSLFPEFPEQFQTKDRLILALQANTGGHNAHRIYSKFNVAKFDDDICKAIILQEEYKCPDFAESIWTPDFVNFCLENAKSYRWFEKMPHRLQTQQIVNTALEHCISNIQYAKPEFITYEIAVEAHRYKRNEWDNSYNYREYVPKHYLEDFGLQTGLPVDFFGGETNYADLREKRKNFHYCRIGESYVGFFVDRDGREEYNRLMMTRRSPMQFKPSIVFSRIIQTFHISWFEKLIADNDPQFILPLPEKGQKGKQRNKYMGVSHIETIGGTKIYTHSLMGVSLLYTAEIEGVICETVDLESMKIKIKEKDYEMAC